MTFSGNKKRASIADALKIKMGCVLKPHPHICTLFFLFDGLTYQQVRRFSHRYIRPETDILIFLGIFRSNTTLKWHCLTRNGICHGLFAFSPILNPPGSMAHITLDVSRVTACFALTVPRYCLFRSTAHCMLPRLFHSEQHCYPHPMT